MRLHIHNSSCINSSMRNTNPAIFTLHPLCIANPVQGLSCARVNGSVKRISVRVDEKLMT
jgi:hypothetical protein